MIISKTPLRISFVGGGTDIGAYYKTGYGAVVSATINKYVYVTVHKRFDKSIRVSYTKTEIVDSVDELKHDIVRSCLRMVGIEDGVEITSIGEVPAGTGLGSSSSLTVGLLNALFAFKGYTLSSQELMEKACEIEIGVLKQPIGKQDQAAAAFGGISYIRFNADESIERERIWLSDIACKGLERKLMLLYTGIQRSAETILSEQKHAIPSKLDVLDFMRNQADELRSVLIDDEGFGDKFAAILNQGWMKKRSITTNISSSSINELYERARRTGAKGGKLLGAGGGGFLLLYCDEDKQQALREELKLSELDFRFSVYGSRIVYFA